jgi:hypothetical protein
LFLQGDQSDQEIATMKKHISGALAAGLLLAGASAASAAPALPAHLNAALMAPAAQDTLNLTKKQRETAWNDLYVSWLNQMEPSRFHVTVGAVVPKGITTAPMTTKAASDVPALKPYKFAQLERKLVIINPADKKIAEVITR